MLTSMPFERANKATGMPPVRRAPRSLKQEYQEFILHRLEEFKNTLPRAELLRIGDEAVRELQTTTEDQYLLTEVLLLEHVDRIIARRLRLPSFPRWRQKHRALREAQREPTHWGFDRTHPIVPWAARVEPGDVVLVLGAAALPESLYLAAHDAEVYLLDQDLGSVEAAEGRAVAEQLGGGAFQATLVTHRRSAGPDSIRWRPRRVAAGKRKPRGHSARPRGAPDAVSRLAGPAESPFETLGIHGDQAAASAGHGSAGAKRVGMTTESRG